MRWTMIFLGAGLVGAGVLSAACNRYEHPLTFSADVRPILQQNCVKCHQPGGAGYEKSQLDLRTYAGVMAGTRFGQIVIPGDSFNSVLIQLVEHRADPSIAMPFHGKALPEEQIRTLKAWVEQGARP